MYIISITCERIDNYTEYNIQEYDVDRQPEHYIEEESHHKSVLLGIFKTCSC